MPKKEEDKLNDIFSKYADEDDADVITDMEKLCSAVGITDPGEDVRALVMCWKLGAYTVEPFRSGCIKREEFIRSMKTMRKDSINVSLHIPCST